MDDVTTVLNALETGKAQSADALLASVYDQLRQLARAKLSREGSGHTLQPTALVHEAYLRLIGANGEHPRGTKPSFVNERYFLAAAAEAMRRILIESARRRHGPVRGGDRQRVAFTGEEAAWDGIPDTMLDLIAALERLAEHDSAAAEVARLHLLTGVAVEEAGEIMGIGRASAYRHWTYGRAWLRVALSEPEA